MVGSYQILEQREQLLLLLLFHEAESLSLVKGARKHVHEDEADQDREGEAESLGATLVRPVENVLVVVPRPLVGAETPIHNQ
jgi:hypothetical protein